MAKPGTVLAVDDEAENLGYVERCLGRSYEVLVAESGEAGLEVLKQHPEVDVIIVDQRMPGMTGLQMLAESRDLAPHASRLVLTGYADIKDAMDAINEAGVAFYLRKPVSPVELQQAVDTAFQSRLVRRQNTELASRVRHLEARLAELEGNSD